MGGGEGLIMDAFSGGRLLTTQSALSLPSHTHKKIHLMSALFLGNRARTQNKEKREMHTATLQMRRNVDIVDLAKKI